MDSEPVITLVLTVGQAEYLRLAVGQRKRAVFPLPDTEEGAFLHELEAKLLDPQANLPISD